MYPMASKVVWIMTSLVVTLPMKSHDHIIMWSFKIALQTNNYKSISTMSMAINFGRMGIFNEEFSYMKSPDPLIKWSCKVK